LENTEKMKELITISNDLIELINTEEFFNEINSTEIKESLISLNSNLKDRRYTVAVIAAMKAGKSTLFNALLGNDLLPNETAACTVAITEIKFAKESSNVIKKHFKDGSIVEIKASGSKSLQENFHEDIRKCRKNDEVNNVDKYFIEHPIIALQDEQYTGLVENFLLIDTPGPNEANTGDFDTYALKETAYYQLRNADAIVFIFDYQVYKSETNARLLQDIFQGREDIKKDNGKIFFAVNKIDIRTSKDDSKNDIIKNVQKMITYNTGNIIGQPQVLPVSALMGVYGRELKNGTISEASREDCQKKYEGRYSEEQIINGRKYYAKLLPEELAEHLINDSDILGFENRVILDTFRKASSKMIDGVYTRLEDRISEIKQIIDSNIDIHTKGIEELREGIHKSKAEVMKLTEFSSTIQNNFDQKMRAIMVHLTEFISNFSSEINYEIDKQLDKYKDVYKAEGQDTMEEYIVVFLYFADETGSSLVSESRRIVKKEGIARQTLQELIKGPDNNQYKNIFPTGSQLLDINITEDGSCIVDLNSEVRKVKNAQEEKLLVNAIVKTLGQFPTIKRVSFLIDGQVADHIAGSLDLSEPIEIVHEQ
jgi:GTPase Era involved in 16S rRNA processing/spore germination protein GerM